MHFSLYFCDPVLRAPTIGCMLMCLTAGLVGVLVFLRKQSLIGEALSHASYPGVIFGVLFTGIFFPLDYTDAIFSISILLGATLSALAGLWTIHFLETRMKVASDAALCFTLSSFFGIGLTMVSEVQFSFTTLYKRASIYLYGQAATMTDIHIYIYGFLALTVIFIIILFYSELQILTFDRAFAKSLGIHVHVMDVLIFTLLILAVIIGIRSVGVVLMSAMLIAPPVAARQFTNRLSHLFILSGLFGVISGFLGNYLSVEITTLLTNYIPQFKIVLPTGPMIVIVASCICFLSLLFAPERGFLLRAIRIGKFRYKCLCENLLKAIWRMGDQTVVCFDRLHEQQSCSKIYLNFALHRMVKNGWLKKTDNGLYQLTRDGQLRAAKIVRLHRLWEVYLVDYMGVGTEKVHRNAEEMEHIITPELEQQLMLLLNDPKYDPHHQPIPPKVSSNVF